MLARSSGNDLRSCGCTVSDGAVGCAVGVALGIVAVEGAGVEAVGINVGVIVGVGVELALGIGAELVHPKSNSASNKLNTINSVCLGIVLLCLN
jgi:hypothetical protein